MFRVQGTFSAFLNSIPLVRWLPVALLSLGLVSSGIGPIGFQVSTAEAGSLRSGVKMGGGHRMKSRSSRSGSMGYRAKGSGGTRLMRSGSSQRKSGIRVGGRREMTGMRSGGKSGARTYTKRRSVLDGRTGGKRRTGHQVSDRRQMKAGRNIKRINTDNRRGGKRHMGGRQDNRLLNRVNNRNMNRNTNTNTNNNNLTVNNNIRLNLNSRQLATSRSGVTLSGSRRNVSTFREIAGGRQTVVTKRRLNGGGHHRGGRRVATGFSGGGLVVIAGTGGYSSPATGHAAPVDDCAYGTYCTIDLGGPKIITYNDVADYSDGEIIEDENFDDLSDEELERRYGAK